MAKDRVAPTVLNHDGVEIIRAIRDDGAGIGNQALDALLRRHDALQNSLTCLLETHRRGKPISQEMWNIAAHLLFMEAPDEGESQDA